jgi:hypothetical protein
MNSEAKPSLLQTLTNRWVYLARIEGAEAVCEPLIATWNSVAGFSGLTGGFCFFVLTQGGTFTTSSIMDPYVAQNAFTGLLLTAFSLSYGAVTLCLVFFSSTTLLLKPSKSKTSTDLEAWREAYIMKLIEKNGKYFDLPMVMAVVSVFCVLASLIFFLIGNLNSWIWIYAVSFFVLLGSMSFTYSMALNFTTYQWVREFTEVKAKSEVSTMM